MEDEPEREGYFQRKAAEREHERIERDLAIIATVEARASLKEAGYNLEAQYDA